MCIYSGGGGRGSDHRSSGCGIISGEISSQSHLGFALIGQNVWFCFYFGIRSNINNEQEQNTQEQGRKKFQFQLRLLLLVLPLSGFLFRSTLFSPYSFVLLPPPFNSRSFDFLSSLAGFRLFLRRGHCHSSVLLHFRFGPNPTEGGGGGREGQSEMRIYVRSFDFFLKKKPRIYSIFQIHKVRNTN